MSLNLIACAFGLGPIAQEANLPDLGFYGLILTSYNYSCQHSLYAHHDSLRYRFQPGSSLPIIISLVFSYRRGTRPVSYYALVAASNPSLTT